MKSLVLYLVLLFLITYVYDFVVLIPILNKYQVNNIFKNPSYPMNVIFLGILRMFFPLIVAYIIFFIFIKKDFKNYFFYRKINIKNLLFSIFSILLFFLVYYTILVSSIIIFNLRSELFIETVYLAPIILLINLFATIGEETGWRGFLYRELSKYNNNLIVLSILIGIIWASWHFPLIIFSGFNYYTHRILGCLLFLVFCILLTYLMLLNLRRSKSLISTIMIHSVFNTFGSITFLVFPEALYYIIFSPAGIYGIISLIPTILVVRKCIS